MLIRYFDGGLRDIPDELAIAILADPSSDEDISEYTSHWVNVIIHGVLGTLFDEETSFENNVANSLRELETPSEENKLQAIKLIRSYNIDIKDSDIGMFDSSDMI